MSVLVLVGTAVLVGVWLVTDLRRIERKTGGRVWRRYR